MWWLPSCWKHVGRMTNDDQPWPTINPIKFFPLWTPDLDLCQAYEIYQVSSLPVWDDQRYPLVNVNKKLWKITIFHGKTHYFLWPFFNSFLYVYQAGYSPHLSLSKQLDNPKKAVLTEQCPQKCHFQQDFFYLMGCLKIPPFHPVSILMLFLCLTWFCTQDCHARGKSSLFWHTQVFSPQIASGRRRYHIKLVI